MTKKNKQQRKKKSESDDEHNVRKIGKYTQSPSGKNRTIEISDLLNETNTLLYESVIQLNVSRNNGFTALLETAEDLCSDSNKMATNMATEGNHSCREVNTGPTNADIVALLSNIQLKLSGMDKRLET